MPINKIPEGLRLKDELYKESLVYIGLQAPEFEILNYSHSLLSRCDSEHWSGKKVFRLSNDARVSPVRLTNSLGTAGPPRQSGGDTAQDGQDACHHQCHHLFPSGGRYCPKCTVCMFDQCHWFFSNSWPKLSDDSPDLMTLTAGRHC